MIQTMTRRTRSSRRARCRRSRASEKRCTGNFGARTGLRSYNPDVGRWLNRDPIDDKGRTDVYMFTYNSSESWIDPDGMAPQWNWNQGGGGGGSGNGNNTTTTAIVTVLIGFCANGRCIPAAQTAVRTVVAVQDTVTAGRGLATPICAFIGLAAGGGAVLWVANQVGPPTVVYPNSLIQGQNAVPCSVTVTNPNLSNSTGEETCYLANSMEGYCLYRCDSGAVRVTTEGANGCPDTQNFPLPSPNDPLYPSR